MCDFDKFNPLDIEREELLLCEVNKKLEKLTVENRITWGLTNLPQRIVLSSSFGIQSVVSLHLVTHQCPDIPVILIDTGYLFPETYCYIDQLSIDMKLNLHVFSSFQSSAWQEARYGKLWEQGLEGIDQYNYMNKVEPMDRAFKQLQVKTWFAGLRRIQSISRKALNFLSIQSGILKLLPILDWDDRKVFDYIKMHSLKCHPLWDKGYISLGDVHTTHKFQVGLSKEDTRFFGLKRECGLHKEII